MIIISRRRIDSQIFSVIRKYCSESNSFEFEYVYKNDNPCHADAICTNALGTVECSCKDGYTGDGFTCSDLNECDNENLCVENRFSV